MQEMTASMDEINQKSSEIGKIIKTIEDIAYQTNILALNAAIEAARAGDAGKEFAVVADEVRNLASKSAEASKNTSTLIESSMQSVAKGTKIANETAKSLTKVVENIQNVAILVDGIADAATAEESAASSEELYSQAQMLKNLVSQFKLWKIDLAG